MAAALERLYALFQDAPELGSLIDPAAAAGDGLWQVDPADLQAKLDDALAKERNDPAAAVFGAAAEGTAKAARLLSGRYWLVATNPPFLSRSASQLADGLREVYRKRWLTLAGTSRDGASDWRLSLFRSGGHHLVAPQSWPSRGAFERCRLISCTLESRTSLRGSWSQVRFDTHVGFERRPV